MIDKYGHPLFTVGMEKETVTELQTILNQHHVYSETPKNKGIFSENQEKRI
ncbi:hypothetical protein [Enterococcus faecalis]|uniref:hypothetical protein n=1 Tax=Enterococcus faecalis TaxID=1351 RepID=UPI0021E0704D|nr:hypothetical protein [Enterococcus faecalis]MCU9758953.1 hypothetical protein [Enterococcus faecalis]